MKTENNIYSRLSRGFTLLEVLVSILIMAIVLTAVFQLHSYSIRMNIAGRFYTTAPLLAGKKMAEIASMPEDEIYDDSGDFGEENNGYTWNFTVTEVESELNEDLFKNIRTVNLKITYNDEYTYNLKTHLYTDTEND